MKIKLIKKNKGFTVIEMLITLFILTLIGIALITFQIDLFSLNKFSNNNLIAQEDARRALKNISAEIRSLSPSSLGAYALVQTATSSFTFYNNIDSDSSVEKIRYFLAGSTLKKGITKPTGNPLTYNPTNEIIIALVHNIANATTSIFNYYDTNYDGQSDPLTEPVDTAQVRLIKINLIIDADPLKPPAPLYMTTQISSRNLKDNL
jgi:prepilin-type N-terminal cleavage/methylation domain-containing protein